MRKRFPHISPIFGQTLKEHRVLLNLLVKTSVEVCGSGRSVRVSAGPRKMEEGIYCGSPWWFIKETNYGLPKSIWKILIRKGRVEIIH